MTSFINSDNQLTNATSLVVSSELARSMNKTSGTPAFGKSLLAWAIPDSPELNYRET